MWQVQKRGCLCTTPKKEIDLMSSTLPTPAPPNLAAPCTSKAADTSLSPYWVPEGVVYDELPSTLRLAIRDVIEPTYRELVKTARPGLAMSTGLTIVHLLWLEILDQIALDIPNQVVDSDFLAALDTSATDRQRLIERHLRTVGAKLKASELLLRLQALQAGYLPSASDLAATPVVEQASSGSHGKGVENE